MRNQTKLRTTIRTVSDVRKRDDDCALDVANDIQQNDAKMISSKNCRNPESKVQSVEMSPLSESGEGGRMVSLPPPLFNVSDTTEVIDSRH